MSSFFVKITAFFSAILIWFGAVFNQPEIKPEFPEAEDKACF